MECSTGPSEGTHRWSSACVWGSTKGSAMKRTSKPNPSHQNTDMVSSTGRRAMGMTYVKKPHARMSTARATGL